jgi:hypothetical protein
MHQPFVISATVIFPLVAWCIWSLRRKRYVQAAVAAALLALFLAIPYFAD